MGWLKSFKKVDVAEWTASACEKPLEKYLHLDMFLYWTRYWCYYFLILLYCISTYHKILPFYCCYYIHIMLLLASLLLIFFLLSIFTTFILLLLLLFLHLPLIELVFVFSFVLAQLARNIPGTSPEGPLKVAMCGTSKGSSGDS